MIAGGEPEGLPQRITPPASSSGHCPGKQGHSVNNTPEGEVSQQSSHNTAIPNRNVNFKQLTNNQRVREG
jgi:hypothetical protein